MKQDETCHVLCQKIHTQPEIEMFKTMIDQEYRVHWLLDNLPVAVRNEELGYVSRGYPVGFIATTPKSSKPQHYLFNHVRIIVRYNEIPEEFEGARIVGFEVIPFSIKVNNNKYVIIIIILIIIILDSMNIMKGKQISKKVQQY